MGVVKIRRQGPGKDNYVQHFPLNYTSDELFQDDGFLYGKDLSDDPDDFDLSDTGCEYALVNDQTSNIPYEIYELPNLKEILSLETWNLYLTEEERFHLAAYLPDMDQETFELTMIELLSGGNIFFGSPLEILFHRLKGGFYSLQVSHLREKLKFLQERGYHYSLRSYHESISQKFAEMRKIWSNCQPNTSVEERVQIWKNKKNQKPVLLVDLNAFPLDEELSCKGVKQVMGLPAPRKTAFMNEESITHVPAMDWNGMALNRTKAKGVLKIKPPEMSSKPNQVVLTFPTESLEPFRRPPKGVLKIRPKVYHTSLVERPRTITVPPDQGSPSVFGVHTSKPSPSHSASQWQEENITNDHKLSYVHKLVRAESIYRGSPTPELTNDRQSEDSLNNGSRVFDSAQSSLGKMKTVKGMKISDGSSSFRECFDSQKKGDLWSTSAGLHKSASDNSRRKLTPFHTNVSEAASRNLIAADHHQNFRTYPDQSEHRHRDKKHGEGVDKSLMFPITYKRKKPHTKPSVLQNPKKTSMIASMEPAVSAGANFNQVEKTKVIKIRVKGWNEFNSQYKQGMLDESLYSKQFTNLIGHGSTFYFSTASYNHVLLLQYMEHSCTRHAPHNN